VTELNSEFFKKFEIDEAVTTSMENYFVFACFGDLKNYDFHYKVALLQGCEKIKTIKGKKLAKAFDGDRVERLRVSIQEKVKQ